jgi:molybdopterin molybdotransferase
MPDNISPQGEDVRTGDIVLRQGQLVSAAHIAVLAAVGCVTPMVGRQPRVRILATGSELVEPSDRPNGARIRNSNSHQLCAQLKAMGITARYHGIIADDRAALASAINKAVASSDVILLSGGVSEGDFDYVPDALRDNGFTFHFDSVAMQPGRPTLFGDNGSIWCCGLPGNPVSTFVVFEILIKPFLYRLMGHTWQKQLVKAQLATTFKRRKSDRQATIPVRFTAPDQVTPIEYHGSAHITAMTQCDAFLFVPIGQDFIAQGGVVYVRPL